MNEIEKRKSEQQALNQYASIRHAENDVIGAARIYVDMTEDWPAALILDELMFWTLPKNKTGKTSLKVWHDGYQWLAVSRAEWWERKRLKPRQADLAIEKLVELNLVVKDVYKYNAHPTIHLRLNVPVFFEKMSSVLRDAYVPDKEEESMAGDIQDLYAMMGMAPISPNGDIESPIRDIESPNGEMINSTYQPLPSPTNTRQQKPPKRGDLVDCYIDMLGMPGLKKEQRILQYESLVKIKTGVEPHRKKWQAFWDFIDKQSGQGKDLETFLDWLVRQPKFDASYWPPERMRENWNRAFMTSAPGPQQPAQRLPSGI